ncbi:hypothetical protein VNO78_05512 [Psophocarpus tetragonolobus]|uniref:Uncharacterized protein n=1 Tax=Psophocarpus tetragonolobus TaxID=3891 RepID=A0AAN9XQS7_PSOTE
MLEINTKFVNDFEVAGKQAWVLCPDAELSQTRCFKKVDLSLLASDMRVIQTKPPSTCRYAASKKLSPRVLLSPFLYIVGMIVGLSWFGPPWECNEVAVINGKDPSKYCRIVGKNTKVRQIELVISSPVNIKFGQRGLPLVQ